MNKLISIIIPVRNGENYLEEALLGIKKQNMETEIIVVDDFSNDNTVKIAEKFGCKIISHKKCLGQVAGKNSGLKVANGDFIMFHDHDDIMTEGALQRLYDELLNTPDISAVMAKVQDFISDDCTDKNTPVKKEPYFGLFTGAMLIRKNVFYKTGPFEEGINTGEIISFTDKMQKLGLITKKIDFISTKRRVHNANYGKTNRGKEFKDYAAILRTKIKNTRP